MGGVGEDGDGCSRWSVAGGDDGELLRMQGRLFQLWQCVRAQTEQIVKIGPPTHFIFIFVFLIFFDFLKFFCHVLS